MPRIRIQPEYLCFILVTYGIFRKVVVYAFCSKIKISRPIQEHEETFAHRNVVEKSKLNAGKEGLKNFN